MKQYTTKELADILGISRVAIFRYIKNGAIEVKHLSKRFIVIEETDNLIRFIADFKKKN